MMTAETKAKLAELRTEMAKLDVIMTDIDKEVWNNMRYGTLDTEAIHLATCHAEWSAKRAALIAKFFKEV